MSATGGLSGTSPGSGGSGYIVGSIFGGASGMNVVPASIVRPPVEAER